MKIIKCDICKKTIKPDAESYELSRNGKLKFVYFEVCSDCGKPLEKFLKDRGLLRSEKTEK
jgi:DNA-directed RNA polymerase subunit RPC12/RpoP